MKRPGIKDVETGEELKRWYWLKQELVSYCKLAGLSYRGAKFDILERIANKLDNIDNLNFARPLLKQPASKFDWHSEKLTIDTIITDSYKNTQNVRRFFKLHCGDKFHFSIPFMAFMKKNNGKPLHYAVDEWKKLYGQRKSKDFKTEIPAGNQYNKYIRDFFADNPNMTIKQARHFWMLKKSLPLGKHVYEKTDLQLK